MTAAHKLAKEHGLKEEAVALEGATARDPAMAQMLQTEALADLLEGLAGTKATATAAPIPPAAVGNVTVETVAVVTAPDKPKAQAGKEK